MTVTDLFTYLISYLQNILIVKNPNYQFYFMDMFSVLFVKIHHQHKTTQLSPMFSSRSFSYEVFIFRSIFRSMIHFELIFMKRTRSVSSFFFSLMEFNYSSSFAEEKCLFFITLFQFLCQVSIAYIVWVKFGHLFCYSVMLS